MRLFLFSTLTFLVILFLFDSWRGSPPALESPPKTIFLEVKGLPSKQTPLENSQGYPRPEKIELNRGTPLSPVFPSFNRITELFTPDSQAFPFIETITYKSKVPWLQGRSAWIVDYAARFKTSRHFIARSLNGEVDYLQQEAKEGDRFNVFSLEYPFHFHLLLDLSRKQLWLGVVSEDKVEWLKNYTVCIGREDRTRTSGYLTPLGTYVLGDRIAVYTPESKGFYQGDRVEMIRHFGTRWIPFEKEVKGCTAPAKSLGIHGVPWIKDGIKDGVKDGEDWREDSSSVGHAMSDGCIRLKTDDVEELYAIISSRPTTTTIEITHDFAKADLIP